MNSKPPRTEIVHQEYCNITITFISLNRNIFKIYRTIILPLVLYGFATFLLTLREKRRLRVFENRVLRRIFGHKRDEVTR
jgi:hypothetical protein